MYLHLIQIKKKAIQLGIMQKNLVIIINEMVHLSTTILVIINSYYLIEVDVDFEVNKF